MKSNGQTEKQSAEELIAIESMTKKTIASINEKSLAQNQAGDVQKPL